MNWILRITLKSGVSVGVSLATIEECQSLSERIKTSSQAFIDLTELITIRPSEVAMVSITKGEINIAQESQNKN